MVKKIIVLKIMILVVMSWCALSNALVSKSNFYVGFGTEGMGLGNGINKETAYYKYGDVEYSGIYDRLREWIILGDKYNYDLTYYSMPDIEYGWGYSGRIGLRQNELGIEATVCWSNNKITYPDEEGRCKCLEAGLAINYYFLNHSVIEPYLVMSANYIVINMNNRYEYEIEEVDYIYDDLYNDGGEDYYQETFKGKYESTLTGARVILGVGLLYNITNAFFLKGEFGYSINKFLNIDNVSIDIPVSGEVTFNVSACFNLLWNGIKRCELTRDNRKRKFNLIK